MVPQMQYDVDEIENDFAKDLKVIRIDTEKYEKLTKECGIEIVPTFLLFSHGEALGMMSGILSRQVLKKRILEMLSYTRS